MVLQRPGDLSKAPVSAELEGTEVMDAGRVDGVPEAAAMGGGSGMVRGLGYSGYSGSADNRALTRLTPPYRNGAI